MRSDPDRSLVLTPTPTPTPTPDSNLNSIDHPLNLNHHHLNQTTIHSTSNSQDSSPSTTGRLRLPLSSISRRSTISSSSHHILLPSSSSLDPAQLSGSRQQSNLLNQRRTSNPDLNNISFIRPRAPSLAAIQQHLARQKSEMNQNNNNNNNNNHQSQDPAPQIVLSSSSSSTTTTTTATNQNVANQQRSTSQSIQPSPHQELKSTETIHPLQNSWTLYFDSRLLKRSNNSNQTGGQAYEAGLQTIGTFKSVEQFCNLFNWTATPSQMDMNSSVQIFKTHIKPMWEDPANAKGGKWTLTMKSNSNLSLLDKLWTYLVLGLVGEQIEDTTNPDQDLICGAIVATRPRGNRIQIWIKEKDNVEKINSLGKRLIKTLEINDHSGVSVEFSAHTSGTHGPSKFISIHPHSSGGSSPQVRSANHSNNNTPLIRPVLDPMAGGGFKRGDEHEKGSGPPTNLMRRSTSAEVSHVRTNSAVLGQIPLGFNTGQTLGGPIFRGGLPAPAAGPARASQLSSHDLPIQNGVWRPSNTPPPAGSIPRAGGAQAGVTANFAAANRRPQSTSNLVTLASAHANLAATAGASQGGNGSFHNTPSNLKSANKDLSSNSPGLESGNPSAMSSRKASPSPSSRLGVEVVSAGGS